jgi:hypothetical protein
VQRSRGANQQQPVAERPSFRLVAGGRLEGHGRPPATGRLPVAVGDYIRDLEVVVGARADNVVQPALGWTELRDLRRLQAARQAVREPKVPGPARTSDTATNIKAGAAKRKAHEAEKTPWMLPWRECVRVRACRYM